MIGIVETILAVVVALCLFGTVIWAAEKYLTIPPPFTWVKGILIFILIVIMCALIWSFIVSPLLSGGSGSSLLGHTR
jgi:hypothetical protein